MTKTKAKAERLTGEDLAAVIELFKVREGELHAMLSTVEIARRAGVPVDAVDELRKTQAGYGSLWV